MSTAEVPALGHIMRPPPPGLGAQASAAFAVREATITRVYEEADGVDVGYFPEGTAVRQVQGFRPVGLLYGQLGLAIGAADVLNYAGTTEHTRDRSRIFRRLAETAETFEAVFLGSRAEADLATDRVFRMHTRVEGKTAQASGPHPKGTPYAAFDPDRSLWTMACMAHSAQTVYETFQEPLPAAEREDFWQGYLLFGELFGLSRDNAPATHADFQDYMRDRLTGEELHLTEAAKYMGKQVCFNAPVPGLPRAARERLNLVLRGLLPAEIRELYGLSFDAAQEEDFNRTAAAVAALSKRLPRAITNGRVPFFFDLVKREEARLHGLGRNTVMPENPY